MKAALDALNPARAAALFEAISTEVNRPDLWSGFLSPPLRRGLLHDLGGLRRSCCAQEKGGVVVPAWWEPS